MSLKALSSVFLLLVVSTANAGDRLLATGGAVSIEATAGGGITPWAVLAGYGTSSQLGCAAAVTGLETDDYGFSSMGVACTLNNRIEVSFGRQALDLDGLIPLLGLPDGQQLRQRYAGVKLRLGGDIVYGRYGQWSAGALYKDSEDAWLARVAGADRTSGIDWYVSGGKLFLNGLFHRYTYVNASLRSTSAHQTGLLGFDASRSVNVELAAAVFPRRDFAVGVEYRQKPDKLAFAAEDDWKTLFVAWFPSKHVSVVGAWADLGGIGTLDDQSGLYLSIAGSF